MFTTKDGPQFTGFKGRAVQTHEGESSGGTNPPPSSLGRHQGTGTRSRKAIQTRGKPQRTTAQVRGGVPTPKITAGSLMAALMALPLDLIYEIFEHLHPLDLLNVARTSKLLRSYLMSKASASVWKNSREGVLPPIPECPPDQSEPQWAYFILTRDCTHRKCLNHKIGGHHMGTAPTLVQLVCRQTIDMAKKRFPNINGLQTILDALPYIKRDLDDFCDVKYYHAGAIEKMDAVVHKYWHQITAGNASAQKDFDEFIEGRKTVVQDIFRHASLCDTWSRSVAIDTFSPLNRRRREILERLKALGHDDRDIKLIPAMEAKDVGEFTYDEWIEMRPTCTDATVEKRKERMRIEKKDIFGARRAVAEKLFVDYRKSLNIPKYGLFPTSETMMGLEVFRDVYEREEGGLATEDDYAMAMDALPALCESWVLAKKQGLLARLVAGSNADAEKDQKTSDHNNFNCFKLITSAFYCLSEYTVVYVDSMLGAHACNFTLGHVMISHWNLGCLWHEATTPNAVADVVRAVGLNPNDATPDQMDNLNARLYCQNCPDSEKLARSWRNSVAHACHKHKKELPGWTVLNSNDRDRVVEQENCNQDDRIRRFHCQHCELPPRNLIEMINHILTTHEHASVNDYDVIPSIPPTPLTLDLPRSESPDLTDYNVGFLFE